MEMVMTNRTKSVNAEIANTEVNTKADLGMLRVTVTRRGCNNPSKSVRHPERVKMYAELTRIQKG